MNTIQSSVTSQVDDRIYQSGFEPVEPSTLEAWGGDWLVGSWSVVGKHHTGHFGAGGGRNNQDSTLVVVVPEKAIFLFALDGCSDCAHAEAGAKMILPALRDACWKVSSMSELLTPEEMTASLEKALLHEIARMTLHMTGSGYSGIEGQKFRRNFLLFTLVGAIVTEQWTAIIHRGDGVYGLNDRISVFENVVANSPNYPAYEVLALHGKGAENRFPLRIVEVVETADVSNLMIGTDGVEFLLKAENKKMPLSEEQIGPITRVWDELMQQGGNQVQDWLEGMNSDNSHCRSTASGAQPKASHILGHLYDDVSFVVLRKTGGH